MPKPLLARCRPDSIQEFRAAARRRFDDGLALASSGRGTGAIYVWGYTAEMILKAAYFTLLGLAEDHPLGWATDLRPAIERGRTLGIPWPRGGDGHNVRAWADLLVAERRLRGNPFAPVLARNVRRRGQRFESLWRETLRYRKNVAYHYEVRKVREAAEWFLVHAPVL